MIGSSTTCARRRVIREDPRTLLAVCSIYLVRSHRRDPFNVLGFGLELGFLFLIVNAFNLVDVMDGSADCRREASRRSVSWAVRSSRPRSTCIECLDAPCHTLPRDSGSIAPRHGSTWVTRERSLSVSSSHFVPHGASSDSTAPRTGSRTSERSRSRLFELSLIAPARLRRGLSPFRGSPDYFALRLHEQAGWRRNGCSQRVWCSGSSSTPGPSYPPTLSAGS